MPLLTAQSETYRAQPPRSLYTFVEAHKRGWKDFWESMDGDREKIVDFAEKADVEAPEEWYETLHRFLFDVYPSDPMAKTAAAANFSKFLSNIAEAHIKEPKPRKWYTTRGITEDNFVSMMERAALLDDPTMAIKYLNSRIRDFGSDLYSEFLLAKATKKEFKSIASKMNKKAYDIETKEGLDINADIISGSKVCHSLWPGEVFEVLGKLSHEGKEVIAVEDESGYCGFVFDKWNLFAAE